MMRASSPVMCAPALSSYRKPKTLASMKLRGGWDARSSFSDRKLKAKMRRGVLTLAAQLSHARGATFSKRATRLQTERVEGHFWLGVNLALLAQVENPLNALRHALSARRSLTRAVRLDASYHAAGPLRVLARLQHKLPRLLGGGTSRARANFERAINLAPANTVTRLYFSEMLLETGDKTGARTQLKALLNAPPDSQWAFESARDQMIARKMLDKM